MTTLTIPPTMRAATFTTSGHPSTVLNLTSSIPTPSPHNLRPNELLIKVSYASLNPGGALMFYLVPHFPWSGPWVPEMECSGTIVASCSSKTPAAAAAAGGGGGKSRGRGQEQGESEELQIGSQVVVTLAIEALWLGGCLAEYIKVPRRMCVRVPKGMSMVEAAGMSGGGCTAVQSCELAGLKRGDKVLVTGGSGGVGNALVQVCKAIVGESGRVVATCSGRNEGMVRGLGADETIDYTVHSPLHEYLQKHHSDQPFDAIFDVVEDRLLHKHCPAYLATKGIFVLLGSMTAVSAADGKIPSWWMLFSWAIPAKLERFRPVLLGGVPRRFQMYNTIPDQRTLRKLTELAEQGKFKVPVDSIWKLEEAKKAYEVIMSHRARGKVIVQVES